MTHAHFPFPLLVGDIGGTNARFALADAPGAPLRVLARVHTADFPGVGEAIRAVLTSEANQPRSIILCGAGPVEGRTLHLTNAPWLMDGPALVDAGLCEQGLLLNDFEAQALGLPALTQHHLWPIGPQEGAGGGTQVVLGPGTGLGIGALLRLEGRYVPVPSEACHISFGPVGATEEAYWPHLARAHGRVTAESVISGPGLVRVHEARAAAAGRGQQGLDGAAIVKRAMADEAGEEAATCRAFIHLVARFAGDIAITFLATGGVTLAGGILPRLRPFVDADEFRRIFEDKAPVDSLTRRIVTRLIVQPDAVMAGMAAIGEHPQRYAIEYGRRLWGS